MAFPPSFIWGLCVTCLPTTLSGGEAVPGFSQGSGDTSNERSYVSTHLVIAAAAGPILNWCDRLGSKSPSSRRIRRARRGIRSRRLDRVSAFGRESKRRVSLEQGQHGLLVNGTSGGIHAAVFALAAEGDVLFPRASHISVPHGRHHRSLSTSVRRACLQCRLGHPWFEAGQWTELARACAEHRPDLVVITYPDYFGLAIDGALLRVKRVRCRSLSTKRMAPTLCFVPRRRRLPLSGAVR